MQVKTNVVIPQTVGRRRFISARRKKFSRRMQGEEIYYSQTEGGRRFMSHRCAVKYFGRACFNRLRAKDMELECHMQEDVGSNSIHGSACRC